MTILYFADTRFPLERANGVQTMATCHALAARGHRVTLVTRPDTSTPPRDPFDFYGLPHVEGLRFDPVSGPASPRLRRAQFLMAGVRRLLNPSADVVYTRDLGLAAFLLQIPSTRRPPIVYESHGVSVIVSAEMPALLGRPDLAPSPRKLHRLDRREQRVWRRADAYVTITRALADELTTRYGPRDDVFVVPDGAWMEGTVPALQGLSPSSPGSVPGKRGQTPPTAGYAGHLYPWKGVDVFLEALALVPGVRGVIVGGHPAEPDFARIRDLSRSLGLEGRVELTGLVPLAEVRHRLAPATMLVLPNAPSAISERYTSPLKLFEYLAMGRPIIASDLGSLREVLTSGETALLVPPGDAHALADAMSTLARDAALSSRLAHGAAALASEYTWDRRAERLEAALAAAAA